MSRTRRRAALVVALLLAAAVRVAFLAPAAARPPDDPDNYLPLARSLAEGRGFVFNGRPTAYRPPLYPILLAPLVGASGPAPTVAVLILHLTLGVGTVALTARTASRWGLPPGRVFLAAVLVACDPVLVVQGRSVMTETLAAFLFAATLAALAGPGMRGPVLGGLGFGFTALCRPSTLPAALLSSLAMVATPTGTLGGRLRQAVTLLTMTVVTLLPWALRNALIFGEPVFTTTHGGYTLGLANNPYYYDEVLNGPPDAVWTGENQRRWQHANNLATHGMTEPQADRALRDRALHTIRNRPGDFARASLARLGRFWGVAPSSSVYPRATRLMVALWTVPFWLAVAAGLASRGLWRWPCIAAPAIILALSLVHTVYWTDLRMRAPIVPALALVAAAAGWRGNDERQ